MCGIAEIRETFTESKIGNRKSTKLGTSMLGKRKTNRLHSNCRRSFFLFFSHLIFFRSGSAFSILFPVYQTLTLPVPGGSESATSQQHTGGLCAY